MTHQKRILIYTIIISTFKVSKQYLENIRLENRSKFSADEPFQWDKLFFYFIKIFNSYYRATQPMLRGYKKQPA